MLKPLRLDIVSGGIRSLGLLLGQTQGLRREAASCNVGAPFRREVIARG